MGLVAVGVVAGWISGHSSTAATRTSADGWPATALLIVAGVAVLNTVQRCSDDAKDAWLAPLLGFGVCRKEYVVAMLAVSGSSAAALLMGAVLPFVLARIAAGGDLRGALVTLALLPQHVLGLAGLCAVTILVVLIAGDAARSITTVLVLILAPIIYELVHTMRARALPPPVIQTLLYIHLPPYSPRADPQLLWKLAVYIGIVMLFARHLGDRRLARTS